jgi:hypothetical protein
LLVIVRTVVLVPVPTVLMATCERARAFAYSVSGGCTVVIVRMFCRSCP